MAAYMETFKEIRHRQQLEGNLKRFMCGAGWYVLIDNHLNSDSTAVDSTAVWMTGWARVMTAIAADPVSRNFVMYDILNEPDR
jgi:hypothetical protein